MLSQLYIQNVAVIQKAVIDFSKGLNVFTGETGAGKTILISAIDMVLGERTSREIIRTGEEKAFVSALFEGISPRTAQKLADLGFEHDDGSLLVTREITQAGKNNCKIGGMPATAALLKELAPLLIHTHGQRDSSQLLQSESHMEMIDVFGGYSGLLARFAEAYGAVRTLEEELEAYNLDETQKAQRMDMLAFQIREIEAAELSDPDEEDELTARKRLIKNSEKVIDGLSRAYTAMTGDGEGGIEELFSELSEGVSAAAGYLPEFERMAARVTEIGYELEGFSSELRAFLDDFEYDPRELNQIESRLDAIYKLKRKYGATIAEIIAFGEKAEAELENITMSAERVQKLEKKLRAAREKALELARELTAVRKEAAERFIRLVEGELKFLDMPNVRLSVAFGERPMSYTGTDALEFMFAANAGEDLRPLAKIASGGEAARLMLAIKNVYAERDDVATLIFDEVDTGVSGRAAGKIGQKLKQVSAERQVVCVTHLAQVAAFANHHLLIHKEVEDGRTFTRVKPLTEPEAIKELARITSGELITETSLNSARELWEYSQNIQQTQ